VRPRLVRESRPTPQWPPYDRAAPTSTQLTRSGQWYGICEGELVRRASSLLGTRPNPIGLQRQILPWGPGTEFFKSSSVHTAAFYNGMRADPASGAHSGGDAYLVTAQWNIFWSSDQRTGHAERQNPTGINSSRPNALLEHHIVLAVSPCGPQARRPSSSSLRPRAEVNHYETTGALCPLVRVRRFPAELPQPRQPSRK